VLNVNADTMAAAMAVACGARGLVIAGATAGVLDASGQTVEQLDPSAIDALIGDGTASAGMVAKLRACRDALAAGVAEVAIVDGRDPRGFLAARGTRLRASDLMVRPTGPRRH